MRNRATLLVSIVVLGLSGCFSTVGKRKLVLPPPAPVVEKPLPEPQFEDPPDIETAVLEIPAPLVTLPARPPIEIATQETLPPKPPVRSPKPAATTPVTPEVEQPTLPPTPPTPVPTTPQLGEILTDDQRQQYEADFKIFVMRAQAVLSRASGRRLTARQKEDAQRIRTFLHQAEESKVKDLVTAVQLAKRADLLGTDLLKSLP
jgi:hypothetical protein